MEAWSVARTVGPKLTIEPEDAPYPLLLSHWTQVVSKLIEGRREIGSTRLWPSWSIG
ncbi:MAG: hypothetical protein ACJAV2_004996 [Myxococcota bacterium]